MQAQELNAEDEQDEGQLILIDKKDVSLRAEVAGDQNEEEKKNAKVSVEEEHKEEEKKDVEGQNDNEEGKSLIDEENKEASQAEQLEITELPDKDLVQSIALDQINDPSLKEYLARHEYQEITYQNIGKIIHELQLQILTQKQIQAQSLEAEQEKLTQSQEELNQMLKQEQDGKAELEATGRQLEVL